MEPNKDIAKFMSQARHETQALVRLDTCLAYAKDANIIPHEELKLAGLHTHIRQDGEDGVRVSVTDTRGRSVLTAKLRVTEQDDLIWDGYTTAEDGSKTAASRAFAGALSTDDNLNNQICEHLFGCN